MLDNLNLTHMNGRVYDPVVGRFLSADPYITEPGNTQNHNRYSYVSNNPLSLVDPSGFEYRWVEHPCQNAPDEEGTVTVQSCISLVWFPDPPRPPLVDHPEGSPGKCPSQFVCLPPPQGETKGKDLCSILATADADTIKANLPEKEIGRQLVDGFDSYFDGLGWGLTMFAAKQGWLGPEIGAQSRQIERTLAVGLVAIHENTPKANSAAWAAIQTYPWQAGARLGTGTFMAGSTRIGFGSGVLAGTAAGQGSLAHLAFDAGESGMSPQAMALAALAGVRCP
jgi:RHS repeat-associated protein